MLKSIINDYQHSDSYFPYQLMNKMVLDIYTPLQFGKFCGISPFDIWIGSAGYIYPELSYAIVNQKVSQEETLIDLLKSSPSQTSFKYPLAQGSEIGFLRKNTGDEDLLTLVYSDETLKYIHTHRGEPKYVMWLIDNTEYCFEPNHLDILARTKYFAHQYLEIQKFVLSETHETFEVLSFNELQTAVISNKLILKNRMKYSS